MHGTLLCVRSNEFTFQADDASQGWGSLRYVEIKKEDLDAVEESAKEPIAYLGQIKASSVAGNGVVGSVFYTFPVIAATAGVFSPLCLVVACLLLLFFRPVMLELAAAVRLNGANYIYLLQFSGKLASVIGAAATLLDAVATSTVSAATASTYLTGEFGHLPVSSGVFTIIFLSAFGLLALAGIRESASLSASVFVFHIISMTMLIIAAIVHWAHSDPHSHILRANWDLRPTGALDIVRTLFYGICIAFLGVTGFECTPSYIQNMRPATYSAVLRNLIIIAAVLNGTLCLLVYALIPSQTILSGANVLSVLAEYAAGRWLRVWVVVDAVGVLLGGVLTGVVSAGGLIDRLAQDNVLPQVFLAKLPVTKSAYVATLTSLAISLLLFVASGMSLNTVSSAFSVAFLFVMFLYCFSNLLLKVNRSRLPREPRVGMLTLFGALVVVCTTWAGNVALNPTSLAVFAVAFIAILTCLIILNAQPWMLRVALRLHSASSFARTRLTRFGALLVRTYKRSRSAQVCIWTKTDDIHTMLQALLSVQRNAPDASTVIFVHAYPSIENIPSELHPNTRLLDEAFPTITVDLAFVQGEFGPKLVEATSRTLGIPRSRMCVLSLGREHRWPLGDYNGVRVIM
ncbi:hypothetical protein DENSPDRAFT_787193 [Dentipellis sp. KUC8613]|nr:hypothetical protein DENSPDRAFT_787193 [Dentipellis sp. KUC8613]